MHLLYTFDSNFLFGCYLDKFSPDISFFLCNMSKYEELAVWIPASALALPSSPASRDRFSVICCGVSELKELTLGDRRLAALSSTSFRFFVACCEELQFLYNN
jgi:hypothetical protein